MKKILAFFVSVILLLSAVSLCACGETKQTFVDVENNIMEHLNQRGTGSGKSVSIKHGMWISLNAQTNLQLSNSFIEVDDSQNVTIFVTFISEFECIVDCKFSTTLHVGFETVTFNPKDVKKSGNQFNFKKNLEFKYADNSTESMTFWNNQLYNLLNEFDLYLRNQKLGKLSDLGFVHYK